jgi:hypothetical protein
MLQTMINLVRSRDSSAFGAAADEQPQSIALTTLLTTNCLSRNKSAQHFRLRIRCQLDCILLEQGCQYMCRYTYYQGSQTCAITGGVILGAVRPNSHVYEAGAQAQSHFVSGSLEGGEDIKSQ